MKQGVLIVAVLIVYTVIVLTVFHRLRKAVSDQDINDFKSKYEQSIQENLQLQSEMDSTIKSLNDSISELDSLVSVKLADIQIIKNNRNEKVNSIDRLSTSDLSKFIAEFYQDSIR